MKKAWLAASILALAAPFAGANGHGGRGSGSGSGSRTGRRSFAGNGFSRPLSRPSFAPSTARASAPSISRASSSRGFSSFGGRATKAPVPTSPTGGSGGGTGGSGGGSGNAQPTTPPPYAAIGAKILTAGQAPVYSYPGASGTHSVAGGAIALNPSQAIDVDRGPGVTLGRPDRVPSGGSGAGGNAVTSNGPAFDPSF